MTAEQLKTFIRSEGYTMSEIARRAGLSRHAMFYRLNRESISVDTLDKVAKAMGISIASFFSDEAYEREVIIKRYKSDNEHLAKLLEEKERMIKLLLAKQKEDK